MVMGPYDVISLFDNHQNNEIFFPRISELQTIKKNMRSHVEIFFLYFQVIDTKKLKSVLLLQFYKYGFMQNNVYF